jgi:hypothetical protein
LQKRVKGALPNNSKSVLDIEADGSPASKILD